MNFNELFNYKDGEIYWKVSKTNRVKVGDKAGSLSGSGYFQVHLNKKQIKLHQIIYSMHHGYIPKQIDHIDGNTLNNRIENLREATHTENMRNTKLRRNNKSGVKGVSWNKANKKWYVQLSIDGKKKGFGYYFDLEVARFVAETMRHKFHGNFAKHN